MSADPPRSRSSLITIALLALAIVPFLATLRHDFVNFDDQLYVTDNELVQQGLTIDGVKYAFTTFYGGNWHPVTWLAHMLDATLFGMRPGWHHLVSVLIHAANTLLLWTILVRITGSTWRSALVGGLFAVHPLHVESVAWVAERKDVLSMLFGLLALRQYLDFIEFRERRAYWWMLAWFCLSLMCKPMFVTLPCVLLLLDIWPLRRWNLWAMDDRTLAKPTMYLPSGSAANLWKEKLPLFALSAAFSVLAVISQSSSNAVSSVDQLSITARITNATVAYGAYIFKTIWPANLTVFYPHPGRWPIEQVAIAAALLVAITIAAIMLRRRAPAVLIGWLIFLGTLVPVIGLLQVGVQAYADRYMYLPSVGLFMMIAWAIPVPATVMSQRVMAAIVGASLIALTAVTVMQVRHWRDGRTLFEHALSVTDKNFVAHHCLGIALEQQGQAEEAMRHFMEATRLRPGYALSRIAAANLLIRQNRPMDAMPLLEEALRIAPYSDDAANSKGAILLAMNQPAEAEKVLRGAIELNAANLEAVGNYGLSLARQQRWAETIAPLQQVAKYHPERVVLRTYLAIALANIGRRDEAVRELQGVLRINPQLEMAQQALKSLTAPASGPAAPQR